MSKPNPHKRKSETQELTLNPRAAQKARTKPPPQKEAATEFSDTEMEDKRTGVRKMTAAEETTLSEGIAALSRRHMRIAIEIIRRGAPGLADDDGRVVELDLDLEEIPRSVAWQLFHFVEQAVVWQREVRGRARTDSVSGRGR